MSRIKLKICGLRTADEAKQLIGRGVDYAGLNFVPSSTRCISIGTAQNIVKTLEASGIQTVAVFQDQPLGDVKKHLTDLAVDYIQLHGDESAEYAQSLNKPIIRAISAASEAEDYPADYFLLDRTIQGKGSLVDLKLAEQIIDSYPGKVFLAGGLTPDNLAVVLSTVQPYAVDIASGVRTDNQLDESKLIKVIDIIRQANSHESVKL